MREHEKKLSFFIFMKISCIMNVIIKTTNLMSILILYDLLNKQNGQSKEKRNTMRMSVISSISFHLYNLFQCNFQYIKCLFVGYSNLQNINSIQHAPSTIQFTEYQSENKFLVYIFFVCMVVH